MGLMHGLKEEQNRAAAWADTFSHRFVLGKENNRERVESALREFGPELIYVHKMSDLNVLETLLASSVPQVRMVHDHDIYCMRSYKYHYVSRKICKRQVSPYCVFPCGAAIGRNHGPGFPIQWVSYATKKREIKLNQRFQKLIVNSRYTRDELLRNGFSADKIEIHTPAQSNKSAPSTQSSFSERNLLLYVGQIIRGKGVDVLIESLKKIRVPFECMILGEGNHRPYCEKLCRTLQLTDRVRFKGFVPPEELRRYYAECSVFLVSSVWPEPFGMVGPEAMRFGLPVVAFDAGGIKEWLNNGYTGYLAPWMDRACFAERVEELLVNKVLARQMGDRGRQWVTRHQDFATQITKMEIMFQRVVAESRKKGVTP